jgi:L-lactate dehydrogenase complex protein LldG
MVHRKPEEIMSSRDKIISAVKGNKPALLPLPVMDWQASTENVVDVFKKTLEGIGGTVYTGTGLHQVMQKVIEIHGNEKRIINQVRLSDGNDPEEIKSESSISLEKVEVAIIEGQLGVAENGAIWVPEHAMGQRALPFICQHLVIVLSIKNIVPTMHQAYGSINISSNGFGVFIAGPSKTADIEQSLVIGAHGARSLLVFLLSE